MYYIVLFDLQSVDCLQLTIPLGLIEASKSMALFFYLWIGQPASYTLFSLGLETPNLCCIKYVFDASIPVSHLIFKFVPCLFIDSETI